MSDRAQVNANLVGPPGVNRDPRQRQHRMDPLGADDARHGFAAAPRARRHLLPIRRVAADRRVDPPPGVDLAPHERDVLLLDLAFAKLSRELFVRGVVLGHHHQAGRAAVEPMDDARPLLAADAAEIVDVVEQRIDERAARVAGGGMDDHARRLVDDDEIVVLIQDGQRQRFGLRLGFDRLGDRHGHVLAGSHRLVRLDGASLEQDVALLDQPLNLRARLLGQHRDEKHIQTRVSRRPRQP